MADPERLPVPVFCTDKVKFGLEQRPTPTLPKFKLEGVTEILGFETVTVNDLEAE